MKMRFLLICLSLGLASTLLGKSGDSTVIVSHDNVLIRTNPSVGNTFYKSWNKYGDASKQYAKVYAELTMKCPPGETCGEWDYLNHITIGRRKGTYNDTLNAELMRFVTPYGIGWTGASNWKHTWRWDITDMAKLLTDSVEIVYNHSGYEVSAGRGWVIYLKFVMIEGLPERSIINVKQIFRKHVPFDSTVKFDRATPPMEINYQANTKLARFKIIQSGHGMDATENCAEFCAKKRFLIYDGVTKDEAYVWRDNCGLNPLYPQYGTWLYDRANWCPGAEVQPYNWDIAAETSKSHSFDVDMEDYNASNASAGYVITVWLIELDSNNYKRDAEIVDIVAPTDDLRFLRNNPICAEPELIIKNNGTEFIGSMAFEYGVEGATQNTYWTMVNIAPGKTKNIRLQRFQNWGNMQKFNAAITHVNDKADDAVWNNKISANISKTIPPTYPMQIVVLHKTNNAPSENAFVILDAANNVFYRRKSYANAATIYRDTVNLYNGCFTFVFTDTGVPPASNPYNKDGISFWAETKDGSGALQIRGLDGSLIKTFAGDWGTEIRQPFTVGWPLNTDKIEKLSGEVFVFPNPAQNEFMLDLKDFIFSEPIANLEIKDINGKIILQKKINSTDSKLQVFDIKKWNSGMYIVQLQNEKETKISKLIIQK